QIVMQVINIMQTKNRRNKESNINKIFSANVYYFMFPVSTLKRICATKQATCVSNNNDIVSVLSLTSAVKFSHDDAILRFRTFTYHVLPFHLVAFVNKDVARAKIGKCTFRK